MKKIISVVSARPNFVKIAPIHKVFQRYSELFDHKICHTGQHYDERMSKIFFDDLGLPAPDFFLGVDNDTVVGQTARVMIEFEKVLLQEKPDAVIIVGDVSSTAACSITAVQMGIPVMHVEAGLRSFDRSMPEEINRILTDSISDFLFVTEKSAIENLKREGIHPGKFFFTGNVMIDSLKVYLPDADKSDILSNLSLNKGDYILVTLHRPANVDSREKLLQIFQTLEKTAEKKNVIFPMHPRTQKNFRNYGMESFLNSSIRVIEPAGYIDFLALLKNSYMVITDSGGIQDETTFLRIPCVTLRDNTERPVTINKGTNYLAGTDMKNAEPIIWDILNGKAKKGSIPELWDGRAAERIVDKIAEIL